MEAGFKQLANKGHNFEGGSGGCCPNDFRLGAKKLSLYVLLEFAPLNFG